jgi:hypothetical protein
MANADIKVPSSIDSERGHAEQIDDGLTVKGIPGLLSSVQNANIQKTIFCISKHSHTTNRQQPIEIEMCLMRSMTCCEIFRNRISKEDQRHSY